jgi:phosphate transport system substrate-binding protein
VKAALAILALAAATPAAARCPADLRAPRALAAPPSDAPYLTAEGAVRIVGYNDMRGLIAHWDALFAARRPGVRFAPDLPATRAAPPALLAGTSPLAPTGAAIEPADLARFRARWGAEPLAVKVAHDSLDTHALSGPLGVVVARGNPLASLSLADIAALFAADARIRTWGDLGLKGVWAERPIHRFGLRRETPLARELQAKAFPGRSLAAEVAVFGHSTEVAATVAGDPLAIGFASLNAASPAVRIVPLSPAPGRPPVAPTPSTLRSAAYPLDRTLLIYARRPLDPFVRSYLELVLSCEGQAAVAKDPLGYIPLAPAQMRAGRAALAEDARRREEMRRTSPGGSDQLPK